jgi:integrase
MLNFSLDDELIEANPAARIDALPEERRQHALTDAELVEVWKAVGSLDPTFCALFRVLILTGQRRGEVAGMRWDEIGADGLGTIPAHRMKAKLAHEVPLPPMALDIVKAMPRIEGGPFVFTGRFGTKPVVSFGLVKGRLDEATADVRPWRTHDLRRTKRSGMSKLKIRPDIAERVIAHIPGSDVAKAYDVFAYRVEKAEALQAWADYVSRLLNPQANVIDLQSRAGR